MQKLIVAICVTAAFCAQASARQIDVPAITPAKIDSGFYAGGAELLVVATGTASLYSGYFTKPDGSLESPVSLLDAPRIHATPGAANYPKTYGGDGVNHFDGGGMNFVPNHGTIGWPVAGKRTTDSQDAATIRFGALIGTFSESPKPEDWFCIGFEKKVKVPSGGAHLYLLVNDSAYSDNSGGYRAMVELSRIQSDPSSADTSSKTAAVYTLSSKVIELPKDQVFGWTVPNDLGLSSMVESSPDLVRWVRATNITFFFKDLDSLDSGQRFYRFVKP
jgi:hypothetical protein